MPHLPPLFVAGGMIETLGGLLLLIGLFTQPVALILSGEMAVAYFKFHAPQGFWPLLNGGEGHQRTLIRMGTSQTSLAKPNSSGLDFEKTSRPRSGQKFFLDIPFDRAH